MGVCVHVHAPMCVCVYEETAMTSENEEVSNGRTYLPHIAIKMAKKTVPPLSNRYVTLKENKNCISHTIGRNSSVLLFAFRHYDLFPQWNYIIL